MKNNFVILITLFLLINCDIFSQDIDKLNKKELREQISLLSSKIDSLTGIITNLGKENSDILKKSDFFEKSNKRNEDEIKKLNNLIKINQVEKDSILKEKYELMISLNKIISEKNELITKQNNIILSKDSLLKSEDDNTNENSFSFDKNDFLNKYFIEQYPLNNNSFELVLTKIIYCSVKNLYYDLNKYSSESQMENKDLEGFIRESTGNYGHEVYIRLDVPELLDVQNFTFWSMNSNMKFVDKKNVEAYLLAQTSSYLNSKLPKIEILKNKLFTLKYNDGKDESFLLNIENGNSTNNHRKFIQFELANEEVKEDGTNNTTKDIVWRIYVIENECYIALNSDQLNRLNLKLMSFNDGIEVSSKYRKNDDYRIYNDPFYFDEEKNKFFLSDNIEQYYEYNITGNGIYITRNKDSYMNENGYVKPVDLIYLFKLK